LVASAFAASCSSASGSTPPSSAGPRLGSESKALSAELEKVRAEFGIRSISAIAWRDGAVTAQAATGIADIRTKAAATPESIYMIASCSKPIVGLALAVLMTEQTIDLDADINTWLKWSSPPRNPGHPGVPVTLRQLVTHRSSLGADDEYEYATYARPDPDPNMEPYFKELLPDSEMWEDFAPGEKEEYSNVGTALAALVIEKAAKTPFSKYCQDRLFTPLGLDDTGWFYSDFDAGQVSKMARPHDEKGNGLEHFGFPNWPSGQIRTTTGDLARLWMAVQSRKAPFTNTLLQNFEKVPFFIQHDGESFDHGGSEYGVGAYFVFDKDDNGYAFLSNHEMPEEQSDELDQALAAILHKYSGVKE
jgi:CubicO group peptidase (beta-lactamase class C family)